MENYIVGLGEILFDCLPDGKKLGGAPANFAYHVSQLGLNGIAVSAIGDDEDGKLVLKELEPRGLKTHLEVVKEPTGTVQVTLKDAIPQYDICLGVAYDNIPWTPAVEEIAKNAKAVCFGSLAQRTEVSRKTVQKFLDTMPEDTLRVFDINLRQSWYSKEVIEESLKRCNVLKINDEEIRTLCQMFDLPEVRDVNAPLPSSELCSPEHQLERKSGGAGGGSKFLKPMEFEMQVRKLIEMFDLKMVVLTCGSFGSYVITPLELSYEMCPDVPVVDTVGAGDSFTGSFMAAILAGKTVKEAHNIGTEVSTFVCTQKGAMPLYPEELIKKVR